MEGATDGRPAEAMPSPPALPVALPATASAPPAVRLAPLRAHTLRDRIVEHLRATGTDSISGIARVLAASGPAPVHRLTVAGYLQALAESGVLRELDRPPSKLYQLASPDAHASLHQRVHRALQDVALPDAERARIALAVLERLLARPIFQAELAHAGFPVPAGAERTVVGDAVRRQYRDLFHRRASPRIDVPPRDPLLHLPATDPAAASPLVDETIAKVLLRATAAEHLVAERPAGPQQVALDAIVAPEGP